MMAPAVILQPTAFASVATTVAPALKGRIQPSLLRPAEGAFQIRTQSVLDYLVATLRKTW
jgi:hypothetical protein